ncbi:MAG: 6-phosphofructokinase [Oscillospiraceae bacterium]|jgi:6-phosphofructokinase 1|nr:6-phosphofructokinase [Oscillospiraceae bacterium]
MAKKRVGILTSGGDCPGLNAAIRGVAYAAYNMMDVQFVGINEGYKGLIEGKSNEMSHTDFNGILTLGGTILGTSRQPYRNMRVIENDNVDKVAAMKANYKKLNLDCLVTLGGNGTHKTANLLSEEGLNVIGLPKTIDNDLYGTDVTFGFHSAVDIATDVVDKIHTTANSHGRAMVIELMGNKAGWLTLYAGMGGGADVILIPEIPYDMEKIIGCVEDRTLKTRNFAIICVAEGTLSYEESKMKKKEREQKRSESGFASGSLSIANQIQQRTGIETRVVVPGHYQRGGSPSPYDRVLATQFGAYAARLIRDGNYGNTVAMIDGKVGHNALKDIAGLKKLVDVGGDMVRTARDMGVSFGD